MKYQEVKKLFTGALVAGSTILATPVIAKTTITAAENIYQQWNSSGVIEYDANGDGTINPEQGDVIVDTGNIKDYIDAGLDKCFQDVSNGKESIVNAVTDVNDKDVNDNATAIANKLEQAKQGNGEYPTWNEIKLAIQTSQKIKKEQVTGLDKDGTSKTQETSAANANNLSLGVAAWVDGEYIVGNGKNERDAYTAGYSAGQQNMAPPNATIEYFYHAHNNTDGGNTVYNTVKTMPTVVDNEGGCYHKKHMVPETVAVYVAPYSEHYISYYSEIREGYWWHAPGAGPDDYGSYVYHTVGYEAHWSYQYHGGYTRYETQMVHRGWEANCGHNNGELVGAKILWD